ncbi:MAG: hypothetical protein LBD24_08720 [Spirochaetaceae bacterium]|nr:hypothetical protein [Spirochaetaceae bacterium]
MKQPEAAPAGSPSPPTASGIPFAASGIPFGTSGIPFTTKGIPFRTKGIPFRTKGIPFRTKGIPFRTSGSLRLFQKLPKTAAVSTQRLLRSAYQEAYRTAGGCRRLRSKKEWENILTEIFRG